MVAAAAFPIAKLGILVVKQISKPLANSITNRAKNSRIFRDYFCIPLAQFFHWADVKIRMRILNLGKIQTVPKLDEKKAIETGAQVFSEFIILFVASAALYLEYRRSAAKEEAKQAALEQEKEDYKDRVRNLEILSERQSAQIRELTRLMVHVRDELVKKNSGLFGGSSKTSIPPLTNLLDGEPAPKLDPVSFEHEPQIFSPLFIQAIFMLPVKLEHA